MRETFSLGYFAFHSSSRFWTHATGEVFALNPADGALTGEVSLFGCGFVGFRALRVLARAGCQGTEHQCSDRALDKGSAGVCVVHHVTSSSLIQRCRQRHHVRISDFLQVRQVTTLGSTLHCLPSMSAQYFINGVNNRAGDQFRTVCCWSGLAVEDMKKSFCPTSRAKRLSLRCAARDSNPEPAD